MIIVFQPSTVGYVLIGDCWFHVDTVLSDHVLCTEIVHRDIQIDPLSYIARRIVKEWLERCTTTHQECSKGRHSDPLFPTRILRIGKKGDNQVHLVEPNGQRGKYVALSHCWGKERNFTTTLETLQSRKDGILISELPKTFQDAIKVVHEIGLQYLWIDSLCIIQDSQQDWEVESARMSYVYSNSHVTLAASRAVSDAQGFLQARTPETIIFEPTPGIVLNHGDRRQGPCEDVPFRKTPLCRRAWAVQERYLSRRTIFFDDSQTFWACQQVSATEDGQESYALRHRASISSLTRFMSPEKASSRIANPLNTDSQDVLPYWRWYAMVCSYMDCDITKKSDRLPALAGLATEIAMRTKEKYYAGLWEHGLIEGLAWQCFKRQPRDVPQYRAPSWSWASLETGLIFVAFQGHNKLASVVDVQVENLSCNPYGEVTGGSLVMDAHLQPVKAIARNDVSTKTRYWSLGMQIVDKWYWVTTVLDREEDHTKPLLVLFLAQTNDKCRVIALAVSPIEQNSNNYRRVGATWSDIKDAPNNPQVGYSVCGGIYLDIESLARERVTLV
ncbi:uncharacterized protein PAC_19348 [Phialocephala subalpina]|uniref:Heterokaryon incompatibility domain-containing protein n=1 Tax=Phialocephala subalpina TaxID=576137 RepID=A0A1L7XWR9_9HELO|nr:uncharacterized protein PAC_19348 [Phialocephala subalpina]